METKKNARRNKMKFNVEINYTGTAYYAIDVKDEDEASVVAEHLFKTGGGRCDYKEQITSIIYSKKEEQTYLCD